MATANSKMTSFRRLGPVMYFKRHRSQDSSSHAIFVVNIPCQRGFKDAIETLFSPFGNIQKIELDFSKASPCALIFFVEEESVIQALETDVCTLWSNFFIKHEKVKNVAKKLIEKHSAGIPVSDNLQSAADKCMLLFEKEEKLEADKRAALREGFADDDGFVTVTHKRKTREIDRGTAYQKKGRKSKTLELKNFYRHQIREEKKDKLSKLRERFEHDKAQIKRLQDSKRFRP